MNKGTHSVSGKIVDISNKKIFSGTVHCKNGRISAIDTNSRAPDQYILPGFIDAHIHVESSLLVPSEFARIAVVHGTVATVSDPHEIGNVLGKEGVNYMIEDAEKVNFKFYFGAPSCVPATAFETAGAEITSTDIDELMTLNKVSYLAEMMNWPGVLARDPLVMEKIKISNSHGLPVDGHAPGLRGEQAKAYIGAGISTDHECFTSEEALDKLQNGMKVIIREGSAARNFDALIGLLPTYWEHMMFCSDDKHPDVLVKGHINDLVRRAVALGMDIFKVLQVACINPAKHYRLDVGQLNLNDPADFIVVKDLETFEITSTYINGELVSADGRSRIPKINRRTINRFNVHRKCVDDFVISSRGKKINVIKAIDGALITEKMVMEASIENGKAVSDTDRDILKLSVVNRYNDSPVATGFIHGIGIRKGALASSVGHDSHNITVVGVDDYSICKAVNLIIENRGGLAAVCDHEEQILPLPVAGLMSTEDGYKVARSYTGIDKLSKSMGSKLSAPFMTLSFMALLVIPSLKLSDKGLFDAEKFEFIDLFDNSELPVNR